MIIPQKEIDVNKVEQEIYQAACQKACEAMRQVLENYDEELRQSRDFKRYRSTGLRKTVFKSRMGDVEYRRRQYKTKEDGKSAYVYLLDVAIGEQVIGHFSQSMAETIAEANCEMSYRHSAQTISETSGQTISHTTAWKVTQALGERANERERADAARAESSKGLGQLEVPLLFEEQDGIWLNMQGKDRENRGPSIEMKVAIAYSGAVQTGRKRYNLINKVACANFEGVKQFVRRKEGVIASFYNVDEVQQRIVNGDGAAWIQRSVTDETVHYQLDTFHRNEAILKYVKDPDARKNIFRLLYSKQIDLMFEAIDAYANSTDDPVVEKSYRELETYFRNNQDGLILYKRRGLDLPEAPEGTVYRNCGAMESNIFSLIGRRMKRRRTNWSIKGGNNMARMLTLKATNRLTESVTGFISETFEQIVNLPLSASQSTARIGKGYNGFRQAEIPSSLPWMKDIFCLKPLV